MRENLKKPMVEVVQTLGITLVVYVLLKYLLPLVIPFLIAFFLAKLLYPLVEKLHKKWKIKRNIIAILILFSFLGVLFLAIGLLGKNLVDQIADLVEHFPAYRQNVIIIWEDYCVRLESWTGIGAETMNVAVIEAIPELWNNVKGVLLPTLVSGSFSWMKGIFVLMAVGVVVGVSTLLILKQYDSIKCGLQKGELGRTVLRIYRRVCRAGGGYLKTQLIIMLVVMGICVAGLFYTGNPYALLVGICIGLCDAMPFLGTGTVFIPWALFELLGGHYQMAAIYAVIYTIANVTRELLEPKLMGDKLGVPPLAVIVSIYVGLKIYGLWGFVLGPLSYILIQEIRKEYLGLDKEPFRGIE